VRGVPGKRSCFRVYRSFGFAQDDRPAALILTDPSASLGMGSFGFARDDSPLASLRMTGLWL